ncbi:CBS domain-containing protein [Rugamonas aquatica]|uniref:CBS domain-containing protein n=1 Tax=Rugamonas aquatica TaxID=2743357 RepID=A0A6A7MXS4_9BURK|nr:CBS domain-containing protein [Rugamonas aquatica]MQA37556.1 CBS domain-containing protein [Rugamonas aquatica]
MSEQASTDGGADKATTSVGELTLISSLFHQINRVLPEQQKLLFLRPDMKAAEALSLLKLNGYSQAPVIFNGSVLGVFSFRSFSLKCADFSLEHAQKERRAPGDFTVDECLEQFTYVRITEELQNTFDAMERDNGVLVGNPELPQGILTPMDLLRYLYRVTKPFVMISEIETALRALMNSAVSSVELAECSNRALAQHYGVGKAPQSLLEMTFDNYRAIISHGGNWPKFAPVLGANRARVSAKLSEIGELRNDIFHFKREITLQEHELLGNHREWLLIQARIVDLSEKEGKL